MLQYFDTLTDLSGNALLGATVQVLNWPALTNATIFSTNGTANPIANNTVVSDITGQISFYAEDGAYQLVYSYQGTPYKTRAPVQITDPLSFVKFADTGAANAYAITDSRLPTQLYSGLKVEIVAANSNTGASTFNMNGTGAKSVVQSGGTALVSGNIVATGIYRFEYDGTNWQLISLQPVNQTLFNGFLQLSPPYAVTAAETALSVTPANPFFLPGTILRYYSGSGDATSAVQTAVNVAQQENRSMVKTGLPGNTFTMANAWTIDTNKTGIDFEGAYINASAFVSGNWCTPKQSASDGNQKPGLNAAHPIMNFTVQGPGIQNTTAVCMQLLDTAGTPIIAGVIFRNIGFQDWGQDVVFGNGAFCNVFDTCTFNVTTAGSGAPATTYSITQQSATNSGERNTFIGCAWYNKTYIAENLGAGSDMYFNCCSLDFATTTFSVGNGTRISADNCHLESNTDAAPWLTVTAQNGVISFRGGCIIVDANKPNNPVCSSNVACTTGGIYLDDVQILYGGTTLSQPFCAGGGVFVITRPHIGLNNDLPMLGPFNNRLAYPGFESASYTADWTLTGSGGSPAPPVRSSAQHHSGSFSLSFPATATNTPTAVRQIAVQAGAYVNGQLWYLFPGSVSGTFFGNLAWVDAGGNVLGSSTTFLTASSAVNSWTLVRFDAGGPLTQAPTGTVFAQLTIDIFGASGASVGYIDDVELYVA